MKLGLPFLAMAPTVWGFSPTNPSPRMATTLLRSDYDAQYQAYSEGGPDMMIQPIQPGMQEVDPYRSSGLQPITPETRHEDRDYGFRIYRDMRREGPEGPARPLRSDTEIGRMGMDRYGRGNMYEDGERIQGSSLRTYGNYGGSNTVDLTSDGRPIHANLEMWAGPDNTAKKVSLYSQDGNAYGIRTTFSSTQQNSVAVRNQGTLEFPVSASVTSEPFMGHFDSPTVQGGSYRRPNGKPEGTLIQGEGMVETFPIAADVQSVQVILQTEGMPMNAKIELLQGPNNAKVVGDIYDDGMHGPFETVIDTPGYSSVLRITNDGPMTYPFHALVLPYTYGEPKNAYDNGRNTQSRFGPDGRW